MSVSEPPPLRAETERAGGLLLVFDGADGRSPTEIGAVLRDVEMLYWLCVETWPDEAHRPSDLGPRVERIALGSPLDLVLNLPPEVWKVGAGFSFAGALAMIFKLPRPFPERTRAVLANPSRG